MPEKAGFRVFDGAAMESQLRSDPAAALRVLADAVVAGDVQLRFRTSMPIAGRGAVDTLRVTFDLDVQMVQGMVQRGREG